MKTCLMCFEKSSDTNLTPNFHWPFPVVVNVKKIEPRLTGHRPPRWQWGLKGRFIPKTCYYVPWSISKQRPRLVELFGTNLGNSYVTVSEESVQVQCVRYSTEQFVFAGQLENENWFMFGFSYHCQNCRRNRYRTNQKLDLLCSVIGPRPTER